MWWHGCRQGLTWAMDPESAQQALRNNWLALLDDSTCSLAEPGPVSNTPHSAASSAAASSSVDMQTATKLTEPSTSRFVFLAEEMLPGSQPDVEAGKVPQVPLEAWQSSLTEQADQVCKAAEEFMV